MEDKFGPKLFVLTPDVELMEYACMEGNPSALISGVVTPWLGPSDSETNMAYPPERQWAAYDQTRRQELRGVVREVDYSNPHGLATIEVDNRIVTVVLAPLPRLDFRGLTEDILRPGVTIAVQGFPGRQNSGEVRAEIVTIGEEAFDMR